ncbi:MAG: hypothetical protein MZW92_62765 [Comamonadaceae bacterium]|nr:hypothetical protein [Comamonadaceae bacterium]
MLKKPAGRAAEAAARERATRRRSSCGRSCATPSTTPPCTWRPSPTRARDVDFAMRWGFGMQQGPFELWQAAGWQQVAELGQGRHRRRQGAVAARRCRHWVFDGPVAEAGGVHTPKARGAPSQQALRAAQRAAGLLRASISPRTCSARARDGALKRGTEVFRNDDDPHLDAGRRGAHRQHHLQAAPRSARPSPRACVKAVELAEAGYKGLVIWSPDDVVLGRRQPRSDAAGVHEVAAPRASRPRSRSCRTRCCGCATRRCRWSRAMRGMALGGGCELAVHCAAPRGGDGELRRPGRSRRRPDPGRRRPDLHRAPRRRDGGGRQRATPTS